MEGNIYYKYKKNTHTHTQQTIQLGRTMCEILLDIVNNINFFFQEYVNKISNYTGYWYYTISLQVLFYELSEYFNQYDM